MKILIPILLALLLPVSVAAWMFWWPDLTHPWWMVLVTCVPTGLLVMLAHRKLKTFKALEDHGLTLLLAAVYFFLPAGALLLLINRTVPHTPTTTHQVVMNRFPPEPDGSSKAWIFLWTGKDIHKIQVTPSDPLYLCRSSDSVVLVHVTGPLGFEYLDHVDRLQ